MARPHKINRERTQQMTVGFSEATRRRLIFQAGEKNVSVAELVRRYVAAGLDAADNSNTGHC